MLVKLETLKEDLKVVLQISKIKKIQYKIVKTIFKEEVYNNKKLIYHVVKSKKLPQGFKNLNNKLKKYY